LECDIIKLKIFSKKNVLDEPKLSTNDNKPDNLKIAKKKFSWNINYNKTTLRSLFFNSLHKNL
jgi:hypothetical protein